MKFLSTGFAALCFLVAACGGTDSPTPSVDGGTNQSTSGDGCTGTQLTDAQLCQLTCGQTTAAEAEQLLGKPDASSGGLIEYTYTCASSSSVIDWDLDFNSVTGLGNVSVTGLGTYAGTTVPSCLSTCAQ